jgi:hypothetical protein
MLARERGCCQRRGATLWSPSFFEQVEGEG